MTLTPLVTAGRIKLRPVYGPDNWDYSCMAKIPAAGGYARLVPIIKAGASMLLILSMAPFGAGNILCIKWPRVGDILK